MTERQQLEFRDFKLALYFKRGGVCEVCGKFVKPDNWQIGHRISQGYVKTFGPRMIHHELNCAVTCDLKCNQKVDITNNPAEVAKLLTRINDAIFEEDESKAEKVHNPKA